MFHKSGAMYENCVHHTTLFVHVVLLTKMTNKSFWLVWGFVYFCFIDRTETLWQHQWRNEPKQLGGGGAQSLRGSVATERGEGVGRGIGVPPPTVGSFFIFRLENVQSGAYLRRKFRLDDMYYMGKRVMIRPIGKRVFFSWTRKNNYANMHPKIIFAKFQTHAMKEVPRRRNEGTKRTSMERMWCGGVSFQCSFLLLLMVWTMELYKRQYTDKH